MKMDYITFIFSTHQESHKVDEYLKTIIGAEYRASSHPVALLLQNHFRVQLNVNFKGMHQYEGINYRRQKGQESIQFSGEFFIAKNEDEIVGFAKILNQIGIDYRIARVDFQKTVEIDPALENESIYFQEMSNVKMAKPKKLKSVTIGTMPDDEYRKISNSRNAIVLYNKSKQIKNLDKNKKTAYRKLYPEGKNFVRLEVRSHVTTNNIELEKCLKSEMGIEKYYEIICKRWQIPTRILKKWELK